MKAIILLLLVIISGCATCGNVYRVREYKSSGIVEIENNGELRVYRKVTYPSTGETVLYEIK